MDRRLFLKGATAAAAIVASGACNVEASVTNPEIASGDALNPPGIRLAGIKMIPVAGGKYKVWTKKLGRGEVKVLLLHGGPGASHDYLEAMESFLPEAGIEMYYYDQLGCGNSDHPIDSSLWTLPRYLEEVEEVRQGLGLEHFVLYGHSWGGILAMEYALRYPQRLRALVISNMAGSADAVVRHTAEWKKQLSPSDRARLEALDAKRDYDNPEYEHLMTDVLYPQMLCRTKPWPEPVIRALQTINETIYVQMQGKSEFLITGNLKHWAVWDRLHAIRTRTLTIGSRYDEMDPRDMEKMAHLVANGSYAYCPNGSHLCMWDDQQVYFRHLLQFLRSV